MAQVAESPAETPGQKRVASDPARCRGDVGPDGAIIHQNRQVCQHGVPAITSVRPRGTASRIQFPSRLAAKSMTCSCTVGQARLPCPISMCPALIST